MSPQTKKYFFGALLTLTTALNLQAMELTPEYPFNVKHEKVSDVNQIVRAVCGYKSGEAIGAFAGVFSASFLISFYNNYYFKTKDYTIANYGIQQTNLLVGTISLATLAGAISATVNQIRYCQQAASLKELVREQTFLDIIKSDNATHAQAWLNFYNKYGTSYSLLYGKIAYSAHYAQHATVKNNNGQTALMLAAQYGSINVAQVLLDAGADLDDLDNEGNSALDYALSTQNEEMIDLLS